MKYDIDKFFIGSLFKYYREQKKISRINLAEPNNNISVSSIRRIEEGQYSSFNMYQTLSKALKLEINTDFNLYIEINSYVKQTYRIINSGRTIDEYVLLRNKISNFYKSYQDYLYVSELSRICLATLNMYLSCTIEDNEIISISKNIINCIDKNSDTYTIICYLLYLYGRYYSRGIIDDKLYLEYGKFLIGKQIFALDEVAYYSLVLNKFGFYKKYEKYMTCTINENDNYLIKVNKLALHSYHYFLLNNINKTTEILNSLINDVNIRKLIPNRIYLNFAKDLAYAYIMIFDYNSALKYFLEIYNANPNIIEIAYVNIFMICESLNKNNIIKKILDNPPRFTSDTIDNIFKYFSLKIVEKMPYKELEEFIIKNFGLKKCNSLQCYGAFKNEMSLLVEKSHDYRTFYKFIKKNDPYIIKYRVNNSIDFREEDFVNILI